MKAITIKQPWATLIALGEKKFETRSWQTKHRGPLAIHAGKGIDKDACREFIDVLNKHGIESINQLPTGAVIATVDLVECHKVIYDYGKYAVLHTKAIIQGAEYTYGGYDEGRFAWELANLNVLPEPVPAKGQLSLWEWTEITYTEWYRETYSDEWTDNHAPLNSLMEEYERYCADNKLTPIWNG